MDLNKVAAVLRPADIAHVRRHAVVELPDLLGLLDRGVERDVGVALLRCPDDRLLADDARNPDARIGLLQRHRPWIDHSVLVMVALEAERPRLRPGPGDEVVRLLEALAVEGRIDAGGELLLAAAAHEAGHQPALGDHVDHRQFFGQANRVFRQRQRIAQHDDLHLLGHAGQEGREDVGLGLHAERRVMMFVQHDAVDADLFGQHVLFDVVVVEPGALDRVEMLVGEHQRRGAEIAAGLLRIGRHRLLGEVHQVHGNYSRPMKSTISLARASGCSMSTQWPLALTISSLALGRAST